MSAKIKELMWSGWPIMQMSCLVNDWKILRETFPPKTGMREKQLLQDPGYVDTVDTCCMLHAMRQGAILIVFTMYVDTVDTIELQCRF